MPTIDKLYMQVVYTTRYTENFCIKEGTYPLGLTQNELLTLVSNRTNEGYFETFCEGNFKYISTLGKELRILDMGYLGVLIIKTLSIEHP
jgi:hypothetical protein